MLNNVHSIVNYIILFECNIQHEYIQFKHTSLRFKHQENLIVG